MGQFRPSQQLRTGALPAPDLSIFTLGFAMAAVAAFSIAGWIGSSLHSIAGTERSQLWLALLGIGFLAFNEWFRLRRGDYCSFGPRRQTPQELGRSPLGVFLWGADTGVPITTVRATPLPLVGLLLILLGFGEGWLAGVAYSGGFLVSLWVLCSKRRRPPESQEAGLVWDPIANPAVRSYSRWAALGVTLLVVVEVARAALGPLTS